MRRKDLELTEEAENFEALCNGYEDRISQLERDNAALMEVARAAFTVDMEATCTHGPREMSVDDDVFGRMTNALDALPARLKAAVERKNATEE